MSIDRKRLLELALSRLQNEEARITQEIEEIQAELRGSGSKSAKPARKAPRKRGRRKMTPDQRKEVSERMKKYWKNRRETGKAAAKST